MDEPQIEAQVEQHQEQVDGAAQAAQVSQGSTEQAASTVGGGKSVVLPREAFNSRLQAAIERGKRAALSEMEEQAKAQGFTSLQDMFATIAALKKGRAGADGRGEEGSREGDQPATREAEREQQRARPRSEARALRELERERNARESERRQRLSEERRRKDLERRLEAEQGERALREQAIMAGVKDIDYAVTLLRRSIDGKTEEELKGFDEGKFFSDLREKHPYLFGEVVRPATTGTGSRAPSAPAPGQVTRGAAESGQVDARKMNDAEFRAHMARRGLNLDVAGV